MKIDRNTGEELPIPPAFVIGGSDTWADPYVVSLLLSGLAQWSWLYREPMVIVTGDSDKGVDREVTSIAEIYNADPHLPIRLEIHRYATPAEMMATEEIKAVFVFSDDISHDERSVDLMARAALAHRAIYQIRRFHT